MNLDQFIATLNSWGAAQTPFFFMVDFERKHPMAIRLADVNPQELLFSINGFSNSPSALGRPREVHVQKFPLPFEQYKIRFDSVQRHLGFGDSFLLNLTAKTPVKLNCSLQEIFAYANARYKCWFTDTFVVFSPETFVQVRGNKIYSFPMKGTIDARTPDAANRILHDAKEKAEHVTIVDLIRNDLSQVATAVKVTRFRYLEEIRTGNANLLQVSSEITGLLTEDYRSHLGELLVKLLPAGSVSGAPKFKTCAVIRDVEGEDRGYYTGVMGCFDGVNLDSGVMIRYIEKQGEDLFYRSGGGITTQSDAAKEYQELIDKIYVPVD